MLYVLVVSTLLGASLVVRSTNSAWLCGMTYLVNTVAVT